jgi:hypothetical protein
VETAKELQGLSQGWRRYKELQPELEEVAGEIGTARAQGKEIEVCVRVFLLPLPTLGLRQGILWCVVYTTGWSCYKEPQPELAEVAGEKDAARARGKEIEMCMHFRNS